MLPFVDTGYFIFLYPVLLILSILFGVWIARKRYLKKGIVWKPTGIEAPVIGVFGLILSFTLNSSNNDYRNRTANLNNEADVAAQMRRESLFMHATTQQKVKEYLIAYTAIQITVHEREWQHTKVLDSVASLNAAFIDFLLLRDADSTANKAHTAALLRHHNNLCTYFYKNAFYYKERTPGIIITILIIGSLLVGVLVGFMNTFTTGYRSYLLPVIYTFLVGMSIIAICDLDNPNLGIIKPDIGNMKYLHQMLQTTRR